jgi:hypothetical protein
LRHPALDHLGLKKPRFLNKPRAGRSDEFLLFD